MNARQEKFVNEYLIDFNATRAVVAAGYTNKSPRSQGARLLADPKIQETLTKRKLELTEKLNITQEQVLQELVSLGYSNLFDFIDIVDGQEIRIKDNIALDKQKSVASIKIGKNGVEIKLYDKIRALEMLGRYTGLFDSKTDTGEKENNLFEMIMACGKDNDFNYIPELQNPLDEPE